MTGVEVWMWTLVRHSAWTVRRDPRFERAVEVAMVVGRAQEHAIARLGGVLLSDYGTAATLEYEVNYPASHVGFLVPRCEGSFKLACSRRVDLYLPTQAERDRVLALDSERRLGNGGQS